MLDEAVSETAPDITAPRADVSFGPVPPKDAEKFIPGAGPPPLPPDAAAPAIKVEPADSIRGRVPLKDAGDAAARRPISFFGRVLRFVGRTLVIAGLCGVAWLAGAYYSHGHSPFDHATSSGAPDAQQSPQHDDMASAVQHMTDEMRALQTSVDARGAAQDAAQTNAANAAQATTGPSNADLMGRVDKLDAEFTAKLSQVNEQLTSIEQQIAASHAALAARTQPAHRHAKHIHDAFNPTQDPNAPGVPHPLGSDQP